MRLDALSPSAWRRYGSEALVEREDVTGTAAWPNLFIVGAAKAGTTALYRYLDEHPDIYMSPMKEPHFFSRIEPDPKLAAFFPHVVDKGAYLALFSRSAGARVRGEASTSYLPSEDASTAIRDVSPDAKIVIMLRNPVSRAFSHYWNDVREGIEDRSFAEAIEQELAGPPGRWGVSSLYVDCGFYAERVGRYLDAFGDNVLILVFEEFVADPATHLERTLRFLGLDSSLSRALDYEAHNTFALPRNALARTILGSGPARNIVRRIVPRSVRAYGRRLLVAPAPKPELGSDVRDRLRDIYASDAERVSDLLGRPLPWREFDAGSPAEVPRNVIRDR
jgi:Sulfotransferase domain